MKHLKYLVMAIFSLCFAISVDAQTSKNKGTTKKVTTAALHYQCPMKCEGDKTYHKKGKCPVCKMELKQIKQDAAHNKFQCPMKCEGDKTYAKEGKCPVCNMNLKHVSAKKSENNHEGHNHN